MNIHSSIPCTSAWETSITSFSSRGENGAVFSFSLPMRLNGNVVCQQGGMLYT